MKRLYQLMQVYALYCMSPKIYCQCTVQYAKEYQNKILEERINFIKKNKEDSKRKKPLPTSFFRASEYQVLALDQRSSASRSSWPGRAGSPIHPLK
jgi:hypothetical protein